MNQVILSAILERRRIRFWYEEEFRTVEPHCYGRSSDGSQSLIGFQLGSNAWHWFHVQWMTRISAMSETFDPQPDYARDEHGLAVVFGEV